MSLLQIVEPGILNQIKEQIRNDCTEFSKLNIGSKVKAADQLYIENRIYKEVGEYCIDTISQMDDEIVVKDNKINILESELKNVNKYDEQKIIDLLNKNPVIRNNDREKAKRRLLNTINGVINANRKPDDKSQQRNFKPS